MLHQPAVEPHQNSVRGWAPQDSDLEQVLVLGLLHGLVPVQVPEPVLEQVLAPEQVLESDLDSYY